MAGLETYGGKCPICGKPMLQKAEGGAGYEFDACPFCGFIITSTIYDVTLKELQDSWESILIHYNVKKREDLINIVKDFGEDKEFYPSVLHITNEYLDKIKQFLGKI